MLINVSSYVFYNQLSELVELTGKRCWDPQQREKTQHTGGHQLAGKSVGEWVGPPTASSGH